MAIRQFREREYSDRPYMEERHGQKRATILRLKHCLEDEYMDWKKAFDL